VRKINKAQAINIAERIIGCKHEEKRCNKMCTFCKQHYTNLEMRRLAAYVLEEEKNGKNNIGNV